MNKLTQPEKAYIIASKFFKELNIIRFNENFYYFKNGVFRLESVENTEAWISKEYIRKFGPANYSQIKEVARFIRDMTNEEYRKQIKRLNEPSLSTVNIKSGVLDLKTLKVTPYTKESFCFHKAPFDYSPNPKCPIFANFLSSSMDFRDEEKIDRDDYIKVMHFIQEWMGYSLLPGNPYHKALILYGAGRNGKGVLMSIWSYILGEHNISNVDIKGLNDGSEIFMTRNKLVNFSGDIQSGQQVDTGIIKSAIAGERVTVNEKYKAQYEMNFTAKLIISCNELPWIRNAGIAVRERFFVLPFLRSFQEHERDPYLKEKLITEADQIFSWAVNGLQRLLERGYFILPERCKTSANEYLMENDSIALWIDEDEIRDNDDKSRVRRSDAFISYKYYCELTKAYTVPRHKFFKKIEEMGYESFKSNGIWYFKNMKLPNQSIL